MPQCDVYARSKMHMSYQLYYLIFQNLSESNCVQLQANAPVSILCPELYFHGFTIIIDSMMQR